MRLRVTGPLALACVVVGTVLGLIAPAAAKPLTAEEIVARNVAARGGLEAWRHLQTMTWMGQLESDTAPSPTMAFTLEEKRPNKTRFEITGAGARTMRIFDGTRGYKVRARHEGGPDIQPYSREELDFARDSQAIDGPLIDYQARRSTVKLVGTEKLEDRKTYHLSVQFSSGEQQDVWVDAQTFLELRIDRPAYSNAAAGGALAVRAGSVAVYYRNYKSFDGVQIPTLIEIGVGTRRTPDRMQIERVVLNTSLDDRLFERPGAPRRFGFGTSDSQPMTRFARPGLRPQAPAAPPTAIAASEPAQEAADTGHQ